MMFEPPLLFSEHLKAGEGQYVEFKSAFHGKPGNRRKRPVKDITKDIPETLISFANAEGGVLYVGEEARIRAISPRFRSNHNYFIITLVLSANNFKR